MKKLLKNKLFICVASGLVFLLFTMPPRNVLSVFTTTEVRPAVVLNTVFGISFGMPAAIGIAIANAIADYCSGYMWITVAEGIIPQFLYTYVPYLLWNKLNKGEDHVHRLDSINRVLKYYLLVLIYAIFSAVLCATQVQLTFGANFLNCLFFVFLNNFTMASVLGYPLMVIMNQLMNKMYGDDRKLFDSEKIIILSAILQIVVITIIIVVVYFEKIKIGTLDIWNSIYVYSIISMNLLMMLEIISMNIIEKRNRRNN